MSKIEQYRQTLRTLQDWDEYLMRESGLPGPRANLELVQAAAEEGDEALFRRWLALTPDQAPTNSPQVFLAVCGAVGLGKVLAESKTEALGTLRALAMDPRWRIREGVAMALQRLGDRDMHLLLREMGSWAQGKPLEQRAAAAALCEPRLLARPEVASRVLDLLDGITASLSAIRDRRSEEFIALRKGLGYCWSVAVVACPDKGKALMEKWLASQDRDVQWIMKENLSKARLARMDAGWVEGAKALLRRH